MRRPPFALLALLFLFAACSQPEPVDVSGQWSGQLGDTDTIAFTVDETNEVDPFDFYATYQDEDLLYEVSSSVRGDRFTLTATATTPELSLTLNVEATVSGDSMTGTYEFRATNAQGGTFTTGGTFAANRL